MSKNNHEKSSDSDRKKPETLEMHAVSLDRTKRLDISHYQRAMPNKAFCWINDMDGEVEKYLEAGFTPVERKSRSNVHYEGITDRGGDKWEKRVVGTHDSGQAMHAYLLMMDKDQYHDVKIKPLAERNQHIQEAMGLAAKKGEVDDKARDGSDLKTYAANTPTGAKGFEQMAGQDGFNKLTGS